MSIAARFVHTNLIARDWRALTTGARVTWCYVTDIEDNTIELQSWIA